MCVPGDVDIVACYSHGITNFVAGSSPCGVPQLVSAGVILYQQGVVTSRSIEVCESCDVDSVACDSHAITNFVAGSSPCGVPQLVPAGVILYQQNISRSCSVGLCVSDDVDLITINRQTSRIIAACTAPCGVPQLMSAGVILYQQDIYRCHSIGWCVSGDVDNIAYNSHIITNVVVVFSPCGVPELSLSMYEDGC